MILLRAPTKTGPRMKQKGPIFTFSFRMIGPSLVSVADRRTLRLVFRNEDPVANLLIVAARDAAIEVFADETEVIADRVGGAFEEANRLEEFDLWEVEVLDEPEELGASDFLVREDARVVDDRRGDRVP